MKIFLPLLLLLPLSAWAQSGATYGALPPEIAHDAATFSKDKGSEAEASMPQLDTSHSRLTLGRELESAPPPAPGLNIGYLDSRDANRAKLSASYALSRRTEVYVAIAHVRNPPTGAAYTLGSALDPGRGGRGVTVVLRHSY